MSLPKIKIGDVLYSKEHNCKITVEVITTDDKVVCVWHDNESLSYRELLEPEKLREA